MNPLEVTWIPDETIAPPGPKMVACIVPSQGWYYRINSKDHWKPNVPLIKVPDHGFLDHDSFLECQILELDDYIIQEALRKRGVIGAISPTLCPAIREAIRTIRGLSNSDKSFIHQVMQSLTPQPTH